MSSPVRCGDFLGGHLTPQRPEFKPEAAFLYWHGREVFKGAARHLA
jgi:hypothetical protein